MSVFCQDCDIAIDEASETRKPCPTCGSLKRRYQELTSDIIVTGNLISTKRYKGGVSKRKGLLSESKDGDSFSVARGRFVKINQLVDHENNRYVKKVLDPMTGDVVRDVDKPLSDHQGHGSAKKKT